MTKSSFLLVPLLLLAGCGSPDASDNAATATDAAADTATTTASAAPGADTIRPGQWMVTISGDSASETSQCITPEQLAQSGLLDKNSEGMKDCTVVRNRMSGGVVDVEARCSAEQYPITLKGSYTPTTYDVETAFELTMGGQTLSRKIRSVGKHVSDTCTPEDGADQG